MVDSTSISIKLFQTLGGHKDRVWHAAWNPTGDLLATCSGDKTIKIWGRSQTGGLECKTTLTDQHTRTIRAVAWHPNGDLLASAGFDSQLCIWLKKGDNFECVATMEGHENESAIWDSKGEYLATCGRDKTVWIWDKDEGYEWSCNSILNGHSQDVKKVCWVPGTLILASCSYDDTIKFWVQEDDDWTCVSTLTGHESTVWSIDFTPDGRYLASVSDDHTVKIWARNEDSDKVKYSLISTLSGYHDRAVYSCSWNSDGTILATAGGDDKICLFVKNEGTSGDTLPTFELADCKENAHYTDVNCVIFHPTENILVSTGDDAIINVWTIN